MLRPTPTWRRFEAEDEAAVAAATPLHVSLARYDAMWRHARSVWPDLDADWRENLAGALAVGRAVNGLPPR